MSSVQIKVENLQLTQNVGEMSTFGGKSTSDFVEILPTPEKVDLIVSIDDENVDPGQSDVPNSDKEKGNPIEEIDGPSNNKKQKLMANNNNNQASTTTTCSEINNRGKTRSSTTTLNLTMVGGENININGNEPTTSSSTIAIPRNYNVKIVNGKIMIKIKNQDELAKKFESLVKLPDISSVKTIEIQSDPEDNLYIGYKQFKALCSMSFPQIEKLHIGLNFHESIPAKLFEDFLVKFGENLVHFHVTGGYIGLKKEEFTVRIPALPKLEHFAFQSIYNFDTSKEVINPAQVVVDGGIEYVVLEDENENDKPTTTHGTTDELFKITIFLPKLKCLKEIILGNYIKVITSDPLKSTVEEFSFEYFKQLEVFRVGSPWNQVVHFLPAKFYKVVLKQIQFPDFLKDPLVLGKIAEIFPKLKSVRLYLPSPFVLQQFLQIFSKLELKELYLKTSFLQEGSDGKILCGLYRAKEGEEKRTIAWFGSHGNLDGFEDSEYKLEKNQKGKKKKIEKSKKMLGLGSLRKLENFEFQHIPRKIYFPKFKKTIGFMNYSNGFPGRDYVLHFIQELRIMKKLKNFRFPWTHKDLDSYLLHMGNIVNAAPIGIYPKLLKVNKTNADDDGKKVKSEVKQENQTS